MSRNARLAAHAAVLGLVFAGGTALGAAVGPDPTPDNPTSTVHEGDSTNAPHDEEH